MVFERDVDTFFDLSETYLEVEFEILKEKELLGRLKNGQHLVSALEKGFHLLCEIRIKKL
jgi:hypothetical protein